MYWLFLWPGELRADIDTFCDFIYTEKLNYLTGFTYVASLTSFAKVLFIPVQNGLNSCSEVFGRV